MPIKHQQTRQMCAYDSQGATMETGNTFSNILKKQITQLEAGHVFPNF